MKSVIAAFATLMFCTIAPMAQAQQTWLQIEARPSLGTAQQSAAGYARAIENVNGFRLGRAGWYAVVVGPFANPGEAQLVRRRLRQQALIPADAFTTDGQAYGERFWPIGGASIQPLQPQAPGTAELSVAPPPPADETRAEARRSEALLTAEERRELQIALRWEGYYNAAIDGAFGRGTRGAMRDWQIAKGFEDTGVLTTKQRALLISDYNSILDGLGMAMVRDRTAGIEIEMPTDMVAFDSYNPPFAHYTAVDQNDPHRVLLISQAGDRATLHGLYDIMQTLEIVPERGAREKTPQSFTLTGEGPEIVSHTEAILQNGHVKGFTLIWPTGDERRRLRVLDEMRASFTRIPGVVMDDLAGEPDENQSVDLLAGLEIKRAETSRSGFYVSPRGAVLTAAATVEGCSRITLDGDVDAQISATDGALALLEPTQALAPRGYARFQSSVPRLQSDAVLSGYSFGGALGAPSLTYGKLADLRGLSGEEDMKRFSLIAKEGDAGGPILDVSGAVLGMLLPAEDDGARALPADTAFAADVEEIARFLSDNGVTASAADRRGRLPQGELTAKANDMTVLVGCWR